MRARRLLWLTLVSGCRQHSHLGQGRCEVGRSRCVSVAHGRRWAIVCVCVCVCVQHWPIHWLTWCVRVCQASARISRKRLLARRVGWRPKSWSKPLATDSRNDVSPSSSLAVSCQRHFYIVCVYSADIWSFGITALELAYGQVPFAHLKPMKVCLYCCVFDAYITHRHLSIVACWSNDRFWLLCWKNRRRHSTLKLWKHADGAKRKSVYFNYLFIYFFQFFKIFCKNFSFKDMIDTCLVKDPSKRPTSTKL